MQQQYQQPSAYPLKSAMMPAGLPSQRFQPQPSQTVQPQRFQPQPSQRIKPRTRLMATSARPDTASRALELYLQHAEKNGNARSALRAPPGTHIMNGVMPQQQQRQLRLTQRPSSAAAPWEQLQQKHAMLLVNAPPPAPAPLVHESNDEHTAMSRQLDRYESLLQECAAECNLPPPPQRAAASHAPPDRPPPVSASAAAPPP